RDGGRRRDLGGALDRARRRAQAREARPRRDPRDQRASQGAGPRDHRSDRRHAASGRCRPRLATRRVDQARDAGRRAPSRRRRAPDRESLNALRDLFLLDPEVVFLNHGSFGACPRPVFEKYQAWQRELEREPVDFIARRLPELLAEARTALAAYVGAAPGDLAFVQNATTAVNIAARSLEL